jgi:uncharacterized protein (DUF2062 family)
LKKLICISQSGIRKKKKINKGAGIIIYALRNRKNNFLYLKKAAKFAQKHKCGYLIDACGIDNYEHLVSELLEKANLEKLPVELITVSEANPEFNSRELRMLTSLQLLTGEKILGFSNTFRIYPVKLLASLKTSDFQKNSFHIDILLRASNAGFRIRNCILESFNYQRKLYLPGKSYIINAFLKALIPLPSKRLCERNFQKEKFIEFLTHPVDFLKFLLKENATPGALAAAAAVGMFIGTIPVMGLHTALIIYFSIKLRLNKIMSVNISHLCMPPFVPFACIEIGYFIRHGHWLDVGNFQTLIKEFHLRIADWIIGSLILAPLNAGVFAFITYFTALYFFRRKEKNL